jgi:hypothetical protein
VARAPLVLDPGPHLVAADLLPQAVYEALVAAIPPPVFFEARAPHPPEVRVPPRLAPTAAIVAWTFAAEVVRAALAPALLTRLEEPVAAYARTRFPSLPPPAEWGVEITLTEGRIVRRATGQPIAEREESWDLLTGVMPLVRPADSRGAHSLLAFPGPVSIPDSSPHEPERLTYEFSIGPTRSARRALTKLMGKAS